MTEKKPTEADQQQLFETLIDRRGEGGEFHQAAQQPESTLTTAQGVPVADDQNSLKAGDRGPTLLEDFVAREKLFHFDHERIPERVVHARGVGAHGYFENYESLKELTCADLFQRPGEKVPAFARFSTVAGNKGSADLARDVRGFAVKLYTGEGNWDIVGNNIPVFFIQDAIKFPDLIHAAKEAPDRGFPQAQTAHDNFWDFISLTPESMHMVMWIMSDRTLPRSLRMMEGFGVHTFKLVNAQGKTTWVKFHWKPKHGMQSVLWNEAVKINGADPDYHRRDLWESIKRGDFPEWELGFQLLTEEQATAWAFDVLDPTKLIPEEEFPVKPVGKLVLDRCVDNFFAETEQVAFCTQNIVNGIDFSEDPLLQGRNFSYLDTQLKRLGGPNFTQLPINAPKCPMHHFQQDGHMAMQNPRGRVNYEPNSWESESGPRENPQRGFVSAPSVVQGTKTRIRSASFADHYSQARQFYISQTEVEQAHIASALIFELSKVEQLAIRQRMVAHLVNIDQTLAEQVADGLRISPLPPAAPMTIEPRQNLPASAALSILNGQKQSLSGRVVGCLVTDGVDAALLEKVTDAVKSVGAVVKWIAPSAGAVVNVNGDCLFADQQLEGGPSVLFDVVVLAVSPSGVEDLLSQPAARDFIADAFAHMKYIGYSQPAARLLEYCHVPLDSEQGVISLEEPSDGIALFFDEAKRLRCWKRKK